MTQNQLSAQQNAETSRHNVSDEGIRKETNAETRRSNKVKEKETQRHNEAQERIGAVGNAVKLGTGLLKVANDPSWYNLDKQLVNDTANVAYGAPLGNLVNIGEISTEYSGTGVASNRTKMPGPMIIKFTPMYGAMGPGCAFDVASKNLYAFVRHANSGARNYEAVDLMLYTIAIDMAYIMWGHLRLVYSLLKDAKAENRYYASAIVKAMGYNYTDLQEHISNLRTCINKFAVNLNSFYIPATMPVFSRHMWLVSNIFKDAEIKKSQDYIFMPSVYGVYEQYGAVQYIPYVTPSGIEGITFDNIVTVTNTIVERLLSNEDIGIMSGDILKAYGEAQMAYLDDTPNDFHVASTYSSEVLTQINGATIVGMPKNPASVQGIYQVTSGSAADAFQVYYGQYSVSSATITSVTTDYTTLQSMVYTPTASLPLLQASRRSTFVNMYTDSVKPDDTMVATRLTLCYTVDALSDPNTGVSCTIEDYGTEIVNKVLLITNTDGTALSIEWELVSATGAAATQYLQYFKYDWAPRLFWYEQASAVSIEVKLVTDIQNYAPVSADTLAQMHSVAVLSELGIPLLGWNVRTRKR